MKKRIKLSVLTFFSITFMSAACPDTAHRSHGPSIAIENAKLADASEETVAALTEMPGGMWDLTSFKCGEVAQNPAEKFFKIPHNEPEYEYRFSFRISDASSSYSVDEFVHWGNRLNGGAQHLAHLSTKDEPTHFEYPADGLVNVELVKLENSDEGARSFYKNLFSSKSFSYKLKNGKLVMTTTQIVACPVSGTDGTLELEFTQVTPAVPAAQE